MINRSEIDKLLDELITLGEDRDEMEYWRVVFDDLSEEDQISLYDNLSREVGELRKI